MVFFQLSTWMLLGLLVIVILGAAAIGWGAGKRMRGQSEDLREPFSLMQGSLLAFMGLVLAFALSLAVDRYETRRAAVVDEANAIGTTYLRAQTIAEPQRSDSLALLQRFADTSIRISGAIPGSSAQRAELDTSDQIERDLWTLAGQSLDIAPADTAPRLYVESLNEMFDAQSTRVATLGNRVPTPVLVLEIVGAALALGALALHLAALGRRGVFTAVIAAGLVILILVVSFDLDRPTRGLIQVPAGPLLQARADMTPPPAAPAPTH